MLQPHLLDYLRLAQKGDQQALDRLLAALRPRLEQLARRYAEPGGATESTLSGKDGTRPICASNSTSKANRTGTSSSMRRKNRSAAPSRAGNPIHVERAGMWQAFWKVSQVVLTIGVLGMLLLLRTHTHGEPSHR